jgi:hypothetical protein
LFEKFIEVVPWKNQKFHFCDSNDPYGDICVKKDLVDGESILVTIYNPTANPNKLIRIPNFDESFTVTDLAKETEIKAEVYCKYQ